MKARPTRREFLKVTGTGLAGMTVLGVVGCGGGGSQSGTLEFASFYSADDAKVIAEAIKDWSDDTRTRAIACLLSAPAPRAVRLLEEP